MPQFDFSYFGRNPEEVQRALIDARDSLWENIRSKQSQADIVTLEGNLNKLLLTNPMVQRAAAKSDANEILGNAFQETIIERINNYDFDTMPSRGKDTRQTFEKTTLIASINNAIATIKLLVKEIESMPASIDKNVLLQKLAAVNQQVYKAQQFLNDENFVRFKTTKKMRFQAGAQAGDALNVINYLDTFVKTMNAPTSTMKELGDQFEGWLYKAGQAFADKNVNNILGSLNTGSKPIARGAGQVSYTMNFDKDTFNTIQQQFNVNTPDMTITYNPGSEKQGKADIVFYTKDGIGGEDYRFSAKHWSHGYGDLGHTSIDAGITRSGGISNAEAYKLAVITKVKTMDRIAQAGHNFAKLALAADIAMGISQGNQNGYGYANLLVVKNNSGIRVLDLVDIIKSIENGQRQLTGYDEPEIEDIANRAYQSARTLKDNHTQNYYALMTSVLNKMHVTIYVSAK